MAFSSSVLVEIPSHPNYPPTCATTVPPYELPAIPATLTFLSGPSCADGLRGGIHGPREQPSCSDASIPFPQDHGCQALGRASRMHANRGPRDARRQPPRHPARSGLERRCSVAPSSHSSRSRARCPRSRTCPTRVVAPPGEVIVRGVNRSSGSGAQQRLHLGTMRARPREPCRPRCNTKARADRCERRCGGSAGSRPCPGRATSRPSRITRFAVSPVSRLRRSRNGPDHLAEIQLTEVRLGQVKRLGPQGVTTGFGILPRVPLRDQRGRAGDVTVLTWSPTCLLNSAMPTSPRLSPRASQERERAHDGLDGFSACRSHLPTWCHRSLSPRRRRIRISSGKDRREADSQY